MVARTIDSFDAHGAAVIFEADGVKVTAFLVDHRPVAPVTMGVEGLVFSLPPQSSTIETLFLL